MREEDTDQAFASIWWDQIQIGTKIGIQESNMSSRLFNKAGSSSIWLAGKMAAKSTWLER